MSDSFEDKLSAVSEALKMANYAIDSLKCAETVETEDDLNLNIEEAIDWLQSAIRDLKGGER